MNRAIYFLPVLLVSSVSAEQSDGIEGLLGFTNGDQLHGHYLGFSEKRMKWLRDDLASAPEFELANVRRVILRNGRPELTLKTFAHAATSDGDRIPGRIVSLDDENLLLETEFAGNLNIPRDQLGMLAPNPFGGKIFYQGPFAEDEWEIIESRIQVMTANHRGIHNAGEDANTDVADDSAKGWTHSGAAWYWPGNGPSSALVRKETLPERAVIRCHVSWKSRISLALAFHADFKQPPAVEDGEEPEPAARRRVHPTDTSVYAELFGNSYVLQLNPTHAMLYRATMDDEGKTKVDRMHTSFNNVRLGESGSATVEIRASRPTGEIYLFINDEFVAQWSEIGHLDEAGGPAHAYVGSGAGLAFLMQSVNCSARISDLLVAEWNGIPDAVRSMQTDEHDIVLLTNGTDRFSGKVTGISGERVMLNGRYGDFVFPLDEVAEIRFARSTLSKPESALANTLSLRVHPLGILSGVPIVGDARQLRIDHPACGLIDVDLSAVVIMEMLRGESFLDAWDPEF